MSVHSRSEHPQFRSSNRSKLHQELADDGVQPSAQAQHRTVLPSLSTVTARKCILGSQMCLANVPALQCLTREILANS